MDSDNIYRDYAAMCAEFRQGMQFLTERNFPSALEAFARADLNTGRDEVYKNKYRSYHGVMLLKTGHLNGMDLCRQAASLECHDGDVFYNLAQAELKRGNRRLAITALHQGLEVDETHPDLQGMQREIGARRCCVLSFLDRDHFLNRLLGKLTYHPFDKS
jgi:hypothetical protein